MTHKIQMPKGLYDISNYRGHRHFELAVALTDKCNLCCDFCFENPTVAAAIPPLTIDDIEIATNNLIEYMTPKLKEYDQINIKLWGGELLHDGISDEIFDAYYEMTEKIKRALNIPITIVFLSNGVFLKRERVEKLLHRIGAYIAFSYDPIGRFKTERQYQIFHDSLFYFIERKLMALVSITLSKPNIEYYINHSTIIDEIPSTIDVNFNFYVPNVNWKEHLPSDEDLYNFYKWAIKSKHFNIDLINMMMASQVEEFKGSRLRYCNCYDAIQYNGARQMCVDPICTGTAMDGFPYFLSTDKFPTCVERIRGFDPKEYFYGDCYDEITRDNEYNVRSTLARMKLGCMYCKHLSFCPMPCPAVALFKYYKVNYCPMKHIYDELTEEDYNNYREWDKQSRTKYIVEVSPIHD